MPIYDFKCYACSYEGSVSLKIDELSAWDSKSQCPHCEQKAPEFRRFIKSAPATKGGDKASARSELSKHETLKRSFESSGKKDEMRHEAAKKCDRNQIGEAREHVKRGTFEGF